MITPEFERTIQKMMMAGWIDSEMRNKTTPDNVKGGFHLTDVGKKRVSTLYKLIQELRISDDEMMALKQIVMICSLPTPGGPSDAPDSQLPPRN